MANRGFRHHGAAPLRIFWCPTPRAYFFQLISWFSVEADFFQVQTTHAQQTIEERCAVEELKRSTAQPTMPSA
jgi:hypothetical protein